MTHKEQAREEISEILSDVLGIGMSPSASISLADVRKLMELCWIRGFEVASERGVSL